MKSTRDRFGATFWGLQTQASARAGRSSDRIRRGDLNTPVEGRGAQEINFLARTFDEMCLELAARDS